MSLLRNPRTLLLITASLFVLILCGCSQDDVTAPTTEDQLVIAVDPLDDVLKSTDGSTPVDPQARLARLAEILELDDAQLAAFTVAYTEFRDGVADLRAQVQAGELSHEEAREAAAVLREAFEAELQIILTPEQYDLLQEMRQNRPGHSGPHHDQQTPHERWTEWLTAIGADEAQMTQIFELLDGLHAGMQELRAEVRAGTLTREEARDAAAALRTEFNETLQTILTVEQYEALLALRPDCDGSRGNGRE